MSVLGPGMVPLVIDFDQYLRSSATPETPELQLPSSDRSDTEPTDLTLDQNVDEALYDIADMVKEACDTYGDEKPPFCVLEKGEKEPTKSVRLIDSDEEAELTLHPWPGAGNRYSFWVFTDRIGVKYICKYDKGYYYVWQGVSAGFSKQAMAQSALNPNKRGRSFSIEGDVQADDRSPVRSLRKRTARQQNPYAMDRLQRQNERKGVVVTESQLEQSLLHQTPERPESSRNACSKQETGTDTTVLPNKCDSSSSLSLPSPSTDDQYIVSQRVVLRRSEFGHVILRSRINSSSGPSIAIFLSTIVTSTQLFETLQKRWQFRLDQQAICYVIVRFPWLDENHSLLLQASDELGYQLLRDEVRRAPEQELGGLVNVDLELSTKPNH